MLDLNKKGVSMIISYVLLIGFSISLAIMVSMWIRGESQKVADSWEMYDCDFSCDDVFLSACYNQDGLSVRNRGNFNIKGVRVQNSTGATNIPTNIGLDQTEVLNIGELPNTIVPAIGEGEDVCLCADKKIEVGNCVP